MNVYHDVDHQGTAKSPWGFDRVKLLAEVGLRLVSWRVRQYCLGRHHHHSVHLVALEGRLLCYRATRPAKLSGMQSNSMHCTEWSYRDYK